MHTPSLVSALWPVAFALHLPTPTFAQDQPSWQQYVRSPPSNIVHPKAILSDHTKGDVKDADGLITGAATTVLTRVSGSDEAPTLVVDFGQNVVGQLLLEFAGSANGTSQGFPGIRLAFSEALEYLTDRSDYTRSDRASGVRIFLM